MSASAEESPAVKRFSRPRGRCPSGKTWDYTTGVWVEDTTAPPPKAKPAVGQVAPAVGATNGADGNQSRLRPKRAKVEEVEEDEPPAKAQAVDQQGHPKRPRGRPPKGKQWDDEKHKWVPEPEALAKAPTKPKKSKSPRKSSSKKSPSGKPRGRPPKGKQWDEVAGSWVDDYSLAHAHTPVTLLPEGAEQHDLPPGWAAVHDPATEKYYYYHKDDATNPTWDKPTHNWHAATEPVYGSAMDEDPPPEDRGAADDGPTTAATTSARVMEDAPETLLEAAAGQTAGAMETKPIDPEESKTTAVDGADASSPSTTI